MRRGNHRRLEKLTNERADGRLEVPVAVTGRPKMELSNEESQPSTIGEANQRTRRRKTGRQDSVLRPLTLHAYLQCLWLLPAGQRGSCRMMRANHRRLEKLTSERADGRLDSMTVYFVHLLSMPTYSACGRYRPVKEGAVE
nr:unnamed protein product [Spirometra erinaceieuropaei]